MNIIHTFHIILINKYNVTIAFLQLILETLVTQDAMDLFY